MQSMRVMAYTLSGQFCPADFRWQVGHFGPQSFTNPRKMETGLAKHFSSKLHKSNKFLLTSLPEVPNREQ
jgi:hypothetical protein